VRIVRTNRPQGKQEKVGIEKERRSDEFLLFARVLKPIQARSASEWIHAGRIHSLALRACIFFHNQKNRCLTLQVRPAGLPERLRSSFLEVEQAFDPERWATTAF
jgi:hypothetical protein